MTYPVDDIRFEQEIHDEIATNGTNSVYVGHGLDPETGEYDVDECWEYAAKMADNRDH